MSWKHLFGHALSAAPDRLHMAAHSHHLWPDATRAAQIACWDDAARLADHKWDRVFGEVIPDAQAGIAAELNLPSPDSIAFSSNTHDLLLRIVSARTKPVRILATDGEFHSFRRQVARWVESGEVQLEVVPCDPAHDLAARFAARARSGDHDIVFASQVFFGTGRLFEGLIDLSDIAAPEGPWLVVDGYHGFMAVPTDLSHAGTRAFYLAGGYKYAMAGEGAAFLHAPPGFGPRPAITGWFAEFEDLTAPPGTIGYAPDARRFLGATFDPSGIYRLAAVFRMLREEGLTTAIISDHVTRLQQRLVDLIGEGAAGPLDKAELLNPLGECPHARFLALRHRQAAQWKAELDRAGIVTDVRGDVLRIGLGLYHDASDIDLFAARCRALLQP